MPPVRTFRLFWIVAGLLLGFAVVSTAPVLLLQDALFSPLNERTLKAEFQSMRYESGGLIFRYTVHNLTRRTVRFEPALTDVSASVAKDRPPVGYPNVLLPLNLPAHGSHVVEVRLELASLVRSSSAASDEQTRRVLQNQPPDAPVFPETPVSPLPMRGPITPPQAPGVSDFSLQEALLELNGFVLEDETNGIRLVLPRGW